MGAQNVYNIGLLADIGSVTIPSFVKYIVTEGYSVIGKGGARYIEAASGVQSADGRYWALNEDEPSLAMFGALADDVLVNSASVSIAASANALTVVGATFTADDVGKSIIVHGAGAGGINLLTSIATYIDATHVTLTDNAGTTLSAVAAVVEYGSDDGAAIQAALSYGGPGVVRGKGLSWTNQPLIIPNAHRLKGLGGEQGASTIKCGSAFPFTKIVGDQTLPADPFTDTFDLEVTSTAGFPLGVGGIVPDGGVGVAICRGCTILYTDCDATHLLNCWTIARDVNKTLVDGADITPPTVWETGPGDGQVGFSTRIDGYCIDCSDIPGGTCLWTSHLQEGGGWSDMLFKDYRNGAFYAVQAYDHDPSVGQCNDWDGGGGKPFWCTASDNAETECVDVLIAQQWPAGGLKTPQQDPGLSFGSYVVMRGGGPVGTAIELNGAIGVYSATHLESKECGFDIGPNSRCNVIIFVPMGSNKWSSTGGPFVRRRNTPGNTFRVFNVIKADAAATGNRVILTDDMTGNSYRDESIEEYWGHGDGTYQINGGIRTGPIANLPIPSPLLAGTMYKATDDDPAAPKGRVCDGARYFSFDLDRGPYPIQDLVASGARDGSSSSTLVVTFTKNTTVGNTAVLAAESGDGRTLLSVVDSRGNPVTVDIAQGAGGVTANIGSANLAAANLIGDTWTLTFSGTSTYASAGIYEIEKVAPTSYVGVTKGNNGNAEAGTTGATPARTFTESFLFAMVAYNDAVDRTAGTNWHALTGVNSGAGNRRFVPIWRVVQGAGTDAGIWAGDPATYNAAVVEYKSLGAP